MAHDIAEKVDDEELVSENGAIILSKVIFKIDPLAQFISMASIY